MRGSALLFVAALGFVMIASSVHADTITLTLDTNVGSFGTPPPPNPTGPWATATFTQVNPFEVTLDLHPLAALGDSFISSWGFNSSVSATDLTITPDADTAVKIASTIAPDTFYEPPSTPVYSFGFSFYDSTFMITPPYYFGIYYLPADPFFTITSTVPISAATFDTTGLTAPLVTEALIKDTGGGVWGASIGGVGSPAVPTPSSATGGLVLLSGLALWKLLRTRSQNAL